VPPPTIPLAVVCGALALLLWPVLFGDQTLFYRDLFQQYIGTGRLLYSGNPIGGLLWDPLVNGGQPLLGNPNRFVLYPSRILYGALSPTSALNLEIAIHLFLGGAGSVLLARRLGLGGAGSAVSGLAYSLSGFSISITSHLGRLFAYHWIPWILLAVHIGLCERGKNSWRWRGAVPLLLMIQWLTGSAEIVGMTLVMAIGWTGVCHLRDTRGRKALVQCVGLLALGAGMAAIQILPAAEMVYRSDRGAYAQTRASTDWSMHPLRLPEMVIPGYCGPIDVVDAEHHFWGAGLIDRGYPLIVNIYLGASIAFLALVGWMRSGKDPAWSSLRWLFAILSGAAALVACGEYLPVIKSAWTTIPGFNVFRYPVKALLVVGLPMALLAGRGVDGWLRSGKRNAQRVGLAALAAVPLILLIAGWASQNQAAPILDIFFPERGKMAVNGLPGRLVFVALVFAALAAVGLASGHVRKRLLSIMAVAVVAADLTLASAPFLPLAPRRLLDNTPHIVQEIRSYLSAGRFFRDLDLENIDVPFIEDRAWERADWLLQGISFSGAATFLVPMVFNLDIADLADRRMARLTRATGEVDWAGRVKLFRAAAVEIVLTPEPPGVPGLELVRAYVIAETLPLFMQRVTPRPPMVRWVGGWREVESAPEALGMLVTPNFDPSVEAVRETDAPTTRERLPFLMALHPKTEVWQQVITAPMAGFIVTAIPWHPDMEVRVNGRPVQAERANYAFLGFEIPPGRREVHITFVPRAVFIGGLVTATSAVIWGALLVGMWWSRRRSQTHHSTESSRLNSPRSASSNKRRAVSSCSGATRTST
jgi:hypothetical protein